MPRDPEPPGPPPDADTELGLPVARSGRRYVVLDRLGVGGTAWVYRAEQVALGRTVALKSLQPSARTRAHRQRLVREAWVMGALEHPNVVPVYDVILEDGEPAIAMKQVEGRAWAERIDAPGAPDALEWNLRVLIAVCHAVAFAHEKGFLHRDLKPENVMIGRFGEVLVVDWGLAVRLGPGDGRVPGAAEIDRVSGTPGYLAPEMAMGRGDLLDARTDVYLLGGLLHRVVAGRPPRGDDPSGAPVDPARRLRQAVDEDVPIDPAWPLAELLASALHRNRDRRPATAVAFREAIEAWLARRDALRLVESGRRHQAGVREAIAGGAARASVHDEATRARFAFREAASRAPGLAEAADGEREVALLLADWEVQRGDGPAARLALAGIDAPADLLASIRALEGRQAAAAEELQRFQADSSTRTALGPRLAVTGALAAVWVGSPLLSFGLGVPPGYPRELSVSGFILVFTVVLTAVLWPWFLRSRVNRTLLVLLLATPSFALVMLATCALAGLPADRAAGLEGFTYFVTVSLAAALVDWRLVPSGLAHGAAFVVGTVRPELVLPALGAANLVFGANIAVLSLLHGLGPPPPDPR